MILLDHLSDLPEQRISQYMIREDTIYNTARKRWNSTSENRAFTYCTAKAKDKPDKEKRTKEHLLG